MKGLPGLCENGTEDKLALFWDKSCLQTFVDLKQQDKKYVKALQKVEKGEAIFADFESCTSLREHFDL